MQSSKMMYYLPTEEKLTGHENRVPIKELQLTLSFVSHRWLLDSFKEIGVHMAFSYTQAFWDADWDLRNIAMVVGGCGEGYPTLQCVRVAINLRKCH